MPLIRKIKCCKSWYSLWHYESKHWNLKKQGRKSIGAFSALLSEKIPEDIVNNQENKGKRRGGPAVTWVDSVIVVMSAPLEKLKNQVRDTSSGRTSIYVIDKN